MWFGSKSYERCTVLAQILFGLQSMQIATNLNIQSQCKLQQIWIYSESSLMWSWLMLSAANTDRISNVPCVKYCSTVQVICYCYQSVNVFSYSLIILSGFHCTSQCNLQQLWLFKSVIVCFGLYNWVQWVAKSLI